MEPSFCSLAPVGIAGWRSRKGGTEGNQGKSEIALHVRIRGLIQATSPSLDFLKRLYVIFSCSLMK